MMESERMDSGFLDIMNLRKIHLEVNDYLIFLIIFMMNNKEANSIP
jgi:hypothetical protein